MLVDTLGLALAVVVTSAHIQDGSGGTLLLAYAKRRLTRLERVWADQGCQHGLKEWVKRWCK